MVDIIKFVNGKWKENCYIVIGFNREALIIDPGSDARYIKDIIQSKNLKSLAILNTHAHYDHIGAVHDLKNELAIPFYLHSKDYKLLRYANLYMKLFEGDNLISIPAVDCFFDHMETTLPLGQFSVRVSHIPGHTGGSVCLQIEDYLFTGDTLLKGNVGRVDLPGSDETKLKESLQLISSLPESLVAYPGHGENTPLSYELKNNQKFYEATQWAPSLKQ